MCVCVYPVAMIEFLIIIVHHNFPLVNSLIQGKVKFQISRIMCSAKQHCAVVLQPFAQHQADATDLPHSLEATAPSVWQLFKTKQTV